MQDREGKSIRYDAAEGLPPACKGPSPSRRGGAEGVIILIEAMEIDLYI
jgi:hypothetical protein